MRRGKRQVAGEKKMVVRVTCCSKEAAGPELLLRVETIPTKQYFGKL
jgi:hypothetical protein